MRELEYAVLDVFAERPLEGNPLAVFADGSGLTDETMQAIAREMSLSETTFVLPRPAAGEREHGVRVRIFTTTEELPFAGHPTLGTATYLRLHRPELRGATVVRLHLQVGTIPVTFAAEGGEAPGHFATMRQRDPEFLPGDGPGWPDREEFAEALGVERADLGLAEAPLAPLQVVSTGSAFCVVPLRSMEAIGRLEIAQARARRLLRRIGARFFYCLARTESAGQEGAATWHGRMQFEGGEDPATGSAAGCVAAWLVQHGLAESGQSVVLEQGLEIHRPSRLTVSASRTPAGGVTDVFVGGRTIPVASGRLFRP